MNRLALSRFTNKVTSIVLAVAVLVMYFVVPVSVAEAAAITNASDTMSSLTVSATSTHAIRFVTPTGANQNTDTIIITFPSDFNFTSKTIGTVTFTHGVSTGLESTETLAASPSATAWGAVFSGTQNRVLTLTAPTDGTGAAVLAPSDRIIISYDGTNSINPTTPGSYTTTIGGTFGDAGDITVNILTSNQVDITATVPQSLTFSISDNTISFGTLTAVSARYASGTASGDASEVEAHNIIVGTNAANGYTMTVGGSTLTSGANTISAIGAANTASSAGTEQFGLRMSATGGTGAVSVPYAAAGFAFDTAAFPDIIATASGASSNTTYSARYLANITANTEAGSYTGTVTYVATANF
jgi:hypothetical protein